jgi:hypothetical protein
MKLANKKHQEILDEYYPKGYVVPEGEEGYYHVMFVDILKDGNWKRGVPVVQKYFPPEWAQMLKIIETHNMKAVTGHSEFSIVHDPTAKAREVKAAPVKEDVKSEPKARKQVAK